MLKQLALCVIAASMLTVPFGERQTAAGAQDPPCGTTTHPATYRHVIVLMLENRTYNDIIGNADAPYLNRLSQECGLATNYHAVTHDSLPNYIAATSGKTLANLPHSCTPIECPMGGPSIFSQLGQPSWHSFQEHMPVVCDRNYAWNVNYKPQHNPASYYTGVHPACIANDTPAQSIPERYQWITPDMCNDMHGMPACKDVSSLIRRGDTWTQTFLAKVFATSDYQDGQTLVLITFDEGEAVHEGENCLAHLSDQTCHVPLWVVSAGVHPGARSSALLSHYSLLRASESALGLPLLGVAKDAGDLRKAFNV